MYEVSRKYNPRQLHGTKPEAVIIQVEKRELSANVCAEETCVDTGMLSAIEAATDLDVPNDELPGTEPLVARGQHDIGAGDSEDVENAHHIQSVDQAKSIQYRYSFETVYDQFNDRLLAFIKGKFLGIWERGDAEAILNDAWFSIVRNWHTVGALPGEAYLWSYLRTVVSHKCIDFMRKERSYTSLSNDGSELEALLYSADDMERHVHNRDELERILLSTKTLSAKELKCIGLRAKGKSYDEIARNMNISAANARTTIGGGIKKCNAYVKKHMAYFQEEGT